MIYKQFEKSIINKKRENKIPLPKPEKVILKYCSFEIHFEYLELIKKFSFNHCFYLIHTSLAKKTICLSFNKSVSPQEIVAIGNCV